MKSSHGDKSMSVEQTTQLIALIFNSALMVLLTELLWAWAWYRQTQLTAQLQQVQRSQQILFVNAKPDREHRLQQLRQRRYRLRQQLRLAYGSMLILHYTLAALLLSVFLLALRMLIFANGLITAALLLFVVGAAATLTSTLLLLVDIHHAPILGQSLGALIGQTITQLLGQLRRPRPTGGQPVSMLKVPTNAALPPLSVPKTGTDA
ncbi:MAG: hypothetical protein AAFQ61_13010 [Cyanobacteria bacterium J06626_23]